LRNGFVDSVCIDGFAIGFGVSILDDFDIGLVGGCVDGFFVCFDLCIVIAFM
jgi:hypothetical protein